MNNIQKIKGLKEISHKYTNYFFDLDGVLVTWLFNVVEGR